MDDTFWYEDGVGFHVAELLQFGLPVGVADGRTGTGTPTILHEGMAVIDEDANPDIVFLSFPK